MPATGSQQFRALLNGLYEDLLGLDERVLELDQELVAIARKHEAVRLRGIGPVTASALYALVGDARQYKNGRARGPYTDSEAEDHFCASTSRGPSSAREQIS